MELPSSRSIGARVIKDIIELLAGRLDIGAARCTSGSAAIGSRLIGRTVGEASK